ncbi:MAG TPA: hypothetical protein VGG80_03890 [Acidobacteriaceae bacterium]|jgi:hypothetical protein
MARPSALLAALLLLCVPGLAQTSKPAPPGSIAAHPDWPKAKPADVSSVDAILASLYDVISGPAGQPRDWNRFRSLFIPDARLIPTRHNKTGSGDVAIFTPEQYQERAAAALEKGFFERGIHNTTESFGDIVHVFSTYESRHTKDGEPFQRGINSIQLLKDGNRYWVVTIFWDGETPTTPIPTKYLP